MWIYNNYDRLKGKRRKKYLNNMYCDYITILASTQFEYETPDFNKYFYESAINTGLSAFYQCKLKDSVNYNKWCCTPVHIADTPDNGGIAKKITTHGSDYALELTPDVDCVLIANNSAHLPEEYFTIIADLLAECDISTKSLLKWSRMCPIPKVKTEEQAVKVVNAMKAVLNGEDIICVSDDDTELLQDNTHKSIDDNMYRLTDEKAIEKMHFLSEFHENLLKRACTYRGVPFTQNSKSAQSLSEELHDMDIFSMLYITDCYNQRKKDFERAEKFYHEHGGDSSFSFGFDWSETMKIQIEKIKAMNNPNVENVERGVNNEHNNGKLSDTE